MLFAISTTLGLGGDLNATAVGNTTNTTSMFDDGGNGDRTMTNGTSMFDDDAWVHNNITTTTNVTSIR